jgi:ribosomal-protein-alanine N-acetyltransferase
LAVSDPRINQAYLLHLNITEIKESIMSQNELQKEQKLLFQKLSIRAAPDVLHLWSDREAVRQTNWPYLETLPAVEERLARTISFHNQERNIGAFSVSGTDRQFMGIIGAEASPDKNGEFEVWYFLNRQHRGKGLGKKVLKQFLPLVYQDKRVKTLKAIALVSNTPSWKILESQGFKRTGIQVGGHVKDGMTFDLYEYVLEIGSSN